MIIEEIDESLFISRFEDYKRVVGHSDNGGGNFTYKGLRALFEWLDEAYTEENPYKLDVIGLCCDFSEYKNFDEFLNEKYTTEDINRIWEEIKEKMPEGSTEDIIRAEFQIKEEEILNENTTLIKFGDDLDEGFIIQNY